MSSTKWHILSEAITKAGAKLSGIDMLEILIDVVDETDQKLEKIDTKLSKLMRSHFIKGKHYIRDAASTDALADSNLREQLLTDARQAFTEAASVKESPLLEAQASEMVGICYELLGKEVLALEWYTRAYLVAYNGLLVVDKKFDKTANGFWRSWRKEIEHSLYWSILGIPLGLLSDATDPGNYRLIFIGRERNEYRQYLSALAQLLIAKNWQHPCLRDSLYFENDANFSDDEPASDYTPLV